MKNLELETEPILPKKFINFIKEKSKVGGFIVLLSYISSNFIFGYTPVKGMLNHGYNKEIVEREMKNFFEKIPIFLGGKFFYNISKPGREIAYYFHSNKEK